MKAVKALLLGAGSRGRHAFGRFAMLNPNVLKIVAAAEPDAVKRADIARDHGIADEFLFDDWEKAFVKLPPVDAVIIATQDGMHHAPLLAAMKHNLHVICEKPIVPTLEECRSIQKATSGFGKTIMVAHVLKYTGFFSRIKELVDAGRIGRLVGINLVENVGHVHMSHSFVRGNWRRTPEAAPMILAKSCHDMDMLRWLADAPCESVSSFGNLNYFTAANAPSDAPARCIDGCPHAAACPYEASRIYLGENVSWPVNVITTDLSIDGRLKALREGPYGRCVFKCDNNVVDHQTVSARFENGVSATFTMSAFTMHTHRTIVLYGTAGEITGGLDGDDIVLKDFSSRNIERIKIANPVGGHGGGDYGFAADFAGMVRGDKALGRNSIANSFESHYMAFAAEKSRLEGGRIVGLKDIRG